MKKWIALLLVAVLCLSLAACGGKAETSGKETQGQQESQNTEQTDNEPSEAESSEPEVKTIEITMDNWQDYFEIKDYLSVCRVKDDFGEQKNLDLQLMCLFVLKDGIEYDEYGTSIAIEYDADYSHRDAVCNLDDFTIEILDDCQHTYNDDGTDVIRGRTDSLSKGFYKIHHDRLEGNKVVEEVQSPLCTRLVGTTMSKVTPISEKDDGTYCIYYYPININITRIEGTLVLKQNK